MNLSSNVVKTEAPHFVGLGLLAIKTLNEGSVIYTPETRIRRQTDGYYWTTLYHVFGEATEVGMNAERSDQVYSYKTDFEIWRGN